MACTITIRPIEGPEASWSCKWNIAQSADASDFQSADIHFEHSSGLRDPELPYKNARIFVESDTGAQNEILASNFSCAAGLQFLLDCLAASVAGESPVRRTATLIAPLVEGNIVRSDIIPLRMVDLECIEQVKSFATPLQHFKGRRWDDSSSFTTLLTEAAGGVLVQRVSGTEQSNAALESLHSELDNRLSFPWTIPGVERKTLAILEGSNLHPSRGGTGENFYGAAESLGIDIVVLAVEGHWLQGPEYAHWRKAFVPITFGFDAEFPSRIVAAVKQSGLAVDGLMTTFDCYQVPISAAAEELGLFAEPASAFEIATNKYKMSAFEGHEAFRARSSQEALDIAATHKLPYPIIVKPCNGWGSEDVFKVENDADLARQIGRMNSDRHGAEFVMEHYCDGPEIDVNIVLYDGEILFHEIGDEYPKGAEGGAHEDFHELDTCSPSQLPASEQELLKQHFHQCLLRLGFRNGIYHCEARMQDSRVAWAGLKDGIFALQARENPAAAPPSVWVIEVNPRPPGMKATGVVETTYGVDYWALVELMALRDGARVRSLAQQFRRGAQYHADMLFISATFGDDKQGVWSAGDVTADLLARHPDIAKNVSRSMTFPKNGDVIPKPSSGVNTFVAYMNIFSRKSRVEALEIAGAVRRLVNIEYA